MAQTFNYPLNLVSNTATTISNVFIPSNATIGNVFYTTLTTGNLVVNNVNLGIASLFSGSFIAANNVIAATTITGLLFSSTNIRYFEIKLTVNINTSVATSLDSVFIIRGNYNDSGWAIITSYIGDNSGISFTVNASGQVLYTSTNVTNFSNSIFRYRVEQFSINGTYTSILGNTVGSYILDSVQINNTTDSIPGTSNGGLYVLGGATITKQVNISSTNNITGLGTGGSLTVLGGASINKNLIIGTGLASIFNSNTLGNIYTTGGNVGIGNTNPPATLTFSAVSNNAYAPATSTTGSAFLAYISNPSAVGSINFDFSTFLPSLSTNIPTTRINLTDLGNTNNSFNLLTKIPGGGGASMGSRIFIDGSGNVGINTTNPAFTLDVNGTTKVLGSLTSSTAYYLSLSGIPTIYNTSFVSQGTSTSTINNYYYVSFPTTNNQNFSPIITSSVKYGVPVNGIYLFKFSPFIQNSNSQFFISKNSANGNDLNVGNENLLAIGNLDGQTITAVISMTISDFVTFGFFLGTGTATTGSRATAQIFCLQRTS